MDIAKTFTIARGIRCSQALGREESNELKISQLLYPTMQASDVFFLKTDICQLGTDQRKVNMLAHEYAKKKKITEPCVIGSSKFSR